MFLFSGEQHHIFRSGWVRNPPWVPIKPKRGCSVINIGLRIWDKVVSWVFLWKQMMHLVSLWFFACGVCNMMFDEKAIYTIIQKGILIKANHWTLLGFGSFSSLRSSGISTRTWMKMMTKSLIGMTGLVVGECVWGLGTSSVWQGLVMSTGWAFEIPLYIVFRW